MLELNEARLSRSASSTITGGICLRIGERAFPAGDWDDFVVPILTAWADGVARLLSGSSTNEQVHFMDGPFSIEITQVSPGGWTLDLIERRLAGTQVDRATVDSRALAASVVDASERLLRALALHDWQSREVALFGVRGEAGPSSCRWRGPLDGKGELR